MMKYIFLTLIGLCAVSFLSAQCVDGNCDNGNGTYIYKNGSKYVGNFKEKKAHGYGELFYTSGAMYAGEWVSNKFEGEGTYTNKDGKIYQGIWKNNEFVKAQDLSANTKKSSSIPVAPSKNISIANSTTKTSTSIKEEVTNELVRPQTYVVIVGVARYISMQSLQYTDDDAYKMYAFFKSPEGGAVPDDNIAILIDESATKEKITRKLEEVFSKAGENDMVLFYFSGHGEKDGLLPFDYNGYDNVLEHREINDILAESKAKYKICITDACYSGNMEDVLAFKDNAAKEETARLKKFYNSSFDAFSNSSTVLMLSSKAEETSVENSGLRQGIFSHFLLKALEGKADDDNNSVVTLDEAFKYVKENVNYYTSKYQTPVMVGNIDNLIMSELR